MKGFWKFLLLLVGLLSQLWAAHPMQELVLRDPGTLRPIEGAHVTVYAPSHTLDHGDFTPSTPGLLFEGATDIRGAIDIPDGLPLEAMLHIQHFSYEALRIPLYRLRENGFSLELEPREYLENEILVTATGQAVEADQIPHQIALIDRESSQFLNPPTMAELLGQQGFVFVQKSQLGGGSPNLRGFEANKVLLVVDGVRMNNAIYRSGHLQNVLTVDPEILEQTEVLFGSGAVIYGSDALGGVIHMRTRDPELAKGKGLRMGGNYSVRLGSVNEEKSVHLDLNIGSRKWASLSSISLSDFGDLRAGRWRPNYPDWGLRDSMVIRGATGDSIVANPSPHIQSPSGYQQLHLLQKFLFKPNPQQSHLLNIQLSTSTDIPRYDRLSQTRDGRLRFAEWFYGPQERFLASYRFLDKARNGKGAYDELSLTAAYQFIEESRHDRAFNSLWREQQVEQVQVASLNLDLQKGFGLRHRISYGMEGRYNYVRSTAIAEQIETGETLSIQTRYPAGGTHFAAGAAYATYYLDLRHNLIFQSGARLSYLNLSSKLDNSGLWDLPFAELTQENLAPSLNLGLDWEPTDRWRITSLVGTGFRAPNLDDLAKVFDSQPGTVVVPNPDLKPEYTYQAEASIYYKVPKTFNLTVTGFYTWYDDAIVVRDFPDYGMDSVLYEGVMSNVLANVNAREAWMAGLNMGFEWMPGPLMVAGTFTYTYGFVPAEQTLLNHIPPFYGQLRVAYEEGPFRLALLCPFNAWKRLDANRTSAPFDDPRDLANQGFATEEGWPAWWTLDAKGQYQLSDLITFQAGVENIFDLHYRPYSSRISAPGRNVYVALRGEF